MFQRWRVQSVIRCVQQQIWNVTAYGCSLKLNCSLNCKRIQIAYNSKLTIIVNRRYNPICGLTLVYWTGCIVVLIFVKHWLFDVMYIIRDKYRPIRYFISMMATCSECLWYMYFISGISQTPSAKLASHLLSHAADISHIPLVSAGDCGMTKSSHDGAEQHPCSGTSRLQLQLDFVSHLMRIGDRLSQLPTKDLRGMLSYSLPFSESWYLNYQSYAYLERKSQVVFKSAK